VIGGPTNISRLKILFLIVTINLFSCSSTLVHRETLSTARNSFLYIEKTLILHQCGKYQCLQHTAESLASGFVVKKTKEGSYGVTAAHVCEVDIPPTKPPIQHHSSYVITTLDGEKYKAMVLASDIKNDICLFFVKDLIDTSIIPLARKAPLPGDRVYTIGAPRGIFSPGMVPMFDGIYNGNIGDMSFYSLPANPGSSGSMILNEKGELVGVLHSVYIKFPHIVLSSGFQETTSFIKDNILKFEIYRRVQERLDLKDLFEEEARKFHEENKQSTLSK
jgi:S1-C subfamily serine protease